MDLSHVTWRKSRHSAQNGDCVEVAAAHGLHLARDSKNPGCPALTFTPGEWRIFIDEVKAGQHDLT